MYIPHTHVQVFSPNFMSLAFLSGGIRHWTMGSRSVPLGIKGKNAPWIPRLLPAYLSRTVRDAFGRGRKSLDYGDWTGIGEAASIAATNSLMRPVALHLSFVHFLPNAEDGLEIPQDIFIISFRYSGWWSSCIMLFTLNFWFSKTYPILEVRHRPENVSVIWFGFCE